MVSEKSLIEFLKNQKLMEGLTDSQLTDLMTNLKIANYNPGEIIFEENDTSNDLYIIFEGEVSLLKNEESRGQQYLIGKLQKGEMFGEMSFLGGYPRSLTVKTTYPLLLVQMTKDSLESLSKEIYNKLISNIAVVMIERLRATNDRLIKSSGKEIKYRLTLNEFTRLALNLFVCLLVGCGLTGVAYGLKYSTNYILLMNWSTVALLLFLIFSFVKSHNYSLDKFGLTTASWQPITFLKPAIVGIATLPCLFALKYIVVAFGHKLFLDTKFSVLFLLIYPIYAFLLEFILRGVIQTTIKKIMPYSSWWMIVVYVATIVAVNNFYFGFSTAILVLLLNLSCGIAYFLSKNLLASTLLHCFIFFFLIKFNLVGFLNLT